MAPLGPIREGDRVVWGVMCAPAVNTQYRP
jgi:hypothetical protein